MQLPIPVDRARGRFSHPTRLRRRLSGPRGTGSRGAVCCVTIRHCLELIGEAAAGIDHEFSDQHPQIPWRAVTAMRNRIIHGYFAIDLEVVWHAATEDIPSLIPHLRAMLTAER